MRIALLAGLLLLAPELAAGQARCNKVAFSITLDGSIALFTGSATGDTLLAGPGSFGPNAPGGIYGQVIRVDRMGGPAAARLPDSVREAVVVPWDYDVACRPLPWREGTSWAAPGTPAFYLAALRPPSQWVDGKPTFDLHNPRHLPYTATRPIPEMVGDTALASLLSPDQLFEFFQQFPTVAQMESERLLALRPVDTWVRDHPELAARPPAKMLYAFLQGMASNVPLNETFHVALGTWRFTLRVPGDSARTFYIRSEPHPADRWFPSRTRRGAPPAPARMPPEGFTILAATARTAEALPEATGNRSRHAFYYTLAYFDSSGVSGAHWRGSILALLRQALPGDPAAEAAAAADLARYRERFDQGLPVAVEARYFGGPDGVLRVTEKIPLRGGGEIVLEGEQLSRTVLRPPPP